MDWVPALVGEDLPGEERTGDKDCPDPGHQLRSESLENNENQQHQRPPSAGQDSLTGIRALDVRAISPRTSPDWCEEPPGCRRLWDTSAAELTAEFVDTAGIVWRTFFQVCLK